MITAYCRNFFKNAGFVIAFLALVFVAAGCLDNDDNDITPVPVGYVSIYNAAPDAPGLDVSVDDRQLNRSSFEYTDYSGYLNFHTGDRHLEFSALNASNALIDTTLSVAEGKAYSVFVINGSSGLETLILRDSSGIPAAGNAKIRFVQLSPDAQPFTVNIKDQNGDPIFDETSFREATDFKEIEAKRYSFEVRDADSGDVILTANDIDLRAGNVYTIITRGFKNPPAGNTNVLSVEVL